MHCEVLSADVEGMTSAIHQLKSGHCVALPTETVYGLAADGLNAEAMAKIFEMKGRPTFDPLILHIPFGYDLGVLISDLPDKAAELMQAFWPGGLTVVLPKTDRVPDLATSGHPTVALRCPKHRVMQSILQQFQGPLAAPSANRFGRVSPTKAEHVVEELGDVLDLVIDGGPCEIGVESTILDCTGEQPRILRPGAISREAIEKVVGPVELVERSEQIVAPGMLESHYAPGTPVFLSDEKLAGSLPLPEGVAGLTWSDRLKGCYVLSAQGDPREAAARLFEGLRLLDDGLSQAIYVDPVPEEGLGLAIRDRLQRASVGSVSVVGGKWEERRRG